MVLRVLQIFGTLDRGGAETMIMNLYRKIDRSILQFDFVVHSNETGAYEEEIQHLGGRIYRVPQFKGYNYLEYVRAWRKIFCTRENDKVVHCHVRSTANIILKIAKNMGFITIAHSHNTSNGKGVSASIKNIMQKYIAADYYFACSKDSGRWLFGNKINNNNFFILKNAIDLERFQRNEFQRLQKRTELECTDKLVIGVVGRFTEQKNPYYVLDILEQILKLKENVLLIWIGEGPLYEDILSKAREKRIQKYILFTGTIDNVEEYMQAMDVFLFPSKWEGLPLTLIEAQAAYLPCVISDVIDEEVICSDELVRCSLRCGAVQWAHWVLTCAYQKETQHSIIKKITDKGYNINDTAQWLQQFYMEVG